MPIRLEPERWRCPSPLFRGEAEAYAREQGIHAPLILAPCKWSTVATYHWWCVDIDKAGRATARLVCIGCGRVADRRSDANPDDLPIRRDGRDYCSHCGTFGPIHMHHLAPRHLFDDADWWPTVDLCQQCHAEWHKARTPANKCPERGRAACTWGPRPQPNTYAPWKVSYPADERDQPWATCDRCWGKDDIDERDLFMAASTLCGRCWSLWSRVMNEALMLAGRS